MKSTSDGISHIQMCSPEVTPANLTNAWVGGAFASPMREAADAPGQRVQGIERGRKTWPCRLRCVAF
jgi:hypothetical protein